MYLRTCIRSVGLRRRAVVGVRRTTASPWECTRVPARTSRESWQPPLLGFAEPCGTPLAVTLGLSPDVGRRSRLARRSGTARPAILGPSADLRPGDLPESHAAPPPDSPAGFSESPHRRRAPRESRLRRSAVLSENRPAQPGRVLRESRQRGHAKAPRPEGPRGLSLLPVSGRRRSVPPR